MNSKVDRINSSIENIQEGIKYYLEYIKKEYLSKKISPKEYAKLVKNLNDINTILSSLKSSKIYVNKTLDKIRVINLSIMSLYEEGDYNTIFSEILKTNSYLCKEAKEKDRKRLNNFKTIFNSLSNFYQYRLRKVEKRAEGLGYRDKGLDNVKFILENFLSVKYNFKKLKFVPLSISSTKQSIIDEYTQIIESNEYDSNIKDIYYHIRDYLVKYAKAEIIISNLNQMKEVCVEEEYSAIKNQIEKLLNKYQNIYKENKEKYTNEIQKLNDKKENHPKSKKEDIEDLKSLLHLLEKVEQKVVSSQGQSEIKSKK